MDEFIKLMDEFWILRENDRENYFKIKRALDSELRDFFHKFPDWRVVINNKLIKLEKVPANAMPFMGIDSFETTDDYCLLQWPSSGLSLCIGTHQEELEGS